MARHSVKLLATIGACSALTLALSSGAGALEIKTPSIDVPKPHINVPKPHIDVPTVNLRHHRLSTHANTLPNVNKNKLGGGSQGSTTTTTAKTPFVGPSNGAGSTDAKGVTTTVNTPFVGPSDTGGSTEGKVITETVGGSGAPGGVQQQTAGAAAAAAAAIGGAASGPGLPGGQPTSPVNTLPASVGPNRDSGINLGAVPPSQVTPLNPGSIAPPYGSAAYYNWLTGGGENAAYEADINALLAAAEQEGLDCAADPHQSGCTPGAGTNANAADTALADFQAYISYLLYLLALTTSANTGVNWTPQETADIEQAITACLNSPSTCAQTIANLNAELAGLGVPTVSTAPNGSGPNGSFQVLSTPSQIVSNAGFVHPTFEYGSPGPNRTLSWEVWWWQQQAQFF